MHQRKKKRDRKRSLLDSIRKSGHERKKTPDRFFEVESRQFPLLSSDILFGRRLLQCAGMTEIELEDMR